MAQDAPPDLLADLTAAQREAATHFEGPLLILAGAGSGKTRVITRRVAYLLQQGVRPYNILAITFTNKAAGEMRQRVDGLVPNSRVWISTFHSLGARLLRQYGERLGLNRNFTIYDQQDRNRLVKAALEASNIDSVRFTPERIEAAISKAKNQLLNPERYAAQANDFFTQTVARVYPIYEKKLRDANAVDFDDLLLWPALALKHDAELREELDSRFRFVLIDEYQDTNQAQYAIARGLSVDQPNLCVVGDPDQSIYKWRGSDIRNILDFERDFPNARVITLERNYRSTKSILAVASHLIAHNRQRKPKDLVTENPIGQPVHLLTFETGLDEAEGITARIRDGVDNGRRNYRDFAIFVRINALSRALESAFVKSRIPYQIVKGLAFFERKENRDVLAYLRLLLNPRDDLSFLRAVNEPPRGIGKVSLEHLRAYAEPRDLSLLAAAAHVEQIPTIKGKAAGGLRHFVLLMEDLRQVSEAAPDEIIRQVLDRSGYRAMLANSTDAEDQERLANIEELITAAKQFAEEDGSRTLGDFLENITLASDVDSWDERQDSVSIMTLHSAKGLEFPVVFMAATEQGLLPHERSLAKEEDVEEERRLAFVGITRAMEELYLSHARLREFRGQTLYAVPSMFLDELPEEGTESTDLSARSYADPRAIEQWRTGSKAAEQGWADAGVLPRTKAELLEPKTDVQAPSFVEGMIVRHDKYGAGRVTEISGYGALRKIKVQFSSAGERTFLADKAKLMVVSNFNG
ncbi:MAG TPA: UvrD-helicase domain-containing protein [Gemmataceae bacterium]|nr:UvrD-helicase domain-containing protein [Gemmataceae bacterium]